MYMGNLFATYFDPKGPSLGKTYIKNAEKSYCVMNGLYINWISFSQLISLRILKSNWGVYRCHLYCKFRGKWMKEYFFSEQSVDFNRRN